MTRIAAGCSSIRDALCVLPRDTGSAQTPVVIYASGSNLILVEGNGIHRDITPSPRITSTILCMHTTRTPAGTDMVVTGYSDGHVLVFEIELDFSIKTIASISLCSDRIETVSIVDGRVYAADSVGGLWFFTTDNAEKIKAYQFAPKSRPTCMRILGELLLIGCTDMQLHLLQHKNSCNTASLLTRMHGHTDWVNAVDVLPLVDQIGFQVVTCSQDKSIRIWKCTQGHNAEKDDSGLKELLPPKKRIFRLDNIEWQWEQTALLVGHDGAVNSVVFDGNNTILSASTDRTVIRWTLYPEENYWSNSTRVGEFCTGAAQSIGTGMSLGFVCVRPAGDALLAVAPSGSIVKWIRDASTGSYVETRPVATGHTGAVRGCSWAQMDGQDFLLTCGVDQTTRVFLPTEQGLSEISRPQIHGYDLESIVQIPTLTQDEAIFLSSAADEKVFRCFGVDSQSSFSSLLASCTTGEDAHIGVAVRAPALGLSNKQEFEVDEEEGGGAALDVDETREEENDLAGNVHGGALKGLTEHQLARRTLWPELDKIYGHGHEVHCLAVTAPMDSYVIIASASKASSVADACVRLWYMNLMDKSIRPLSIKGIPQEGVISLGHSLTILRMSFSHVVDSEWRLLAVSRDRTFSVLTLKLDTTLEVPYISDHTIRRSSGDAHSRLLWCGAWLNPRDLIFATGSRDKTVKIWSEAKCIYTHNFDSPVTAMDSAYGLDGEKTLLAVGLESGTIGLFEWKDHSLISVEMYHSQCSAAVNEIKWSPSKREFAAVSEDHSVRIFSLP